MPIQELGKRRRREWLGALTSPRPPVPADVPRPVRTWTRLCLLGCLGVAIVVTLAVRIPTLNAPFAGWTESHWMTMGRTFAHEGRVALRGIPVQNNPPMGNLRDIYIHWPPLFPLVLSYAIDQWGDREQVGRTVMLLVMFANAAALFALVYSAGGLEAGLLAATAWLCSPVVARIGTMVVPVQLALLGSMLAVALYLRASQERTLVSPWSVLGLISTALAVAGSWEAALFWPGLLLAAFWNRKVLQIRLALLFGFTALCVAIGILGWYALQHSALVGDLWHTIVFRLGIGAYGVGHVQLYEWVNAVEYGNTLSRASLSGTILRYGWRIAWLGPAALAALLFVGVAVARERANSRLDGARVVLCSLTSMWALWFLVMRNHSTIHEFEMLLGASVCAAAIGIAIGWLAENQGRMAEIVARTVPASAIYVIGSIALLSGLRAQIQESREGLNSADLSRLEYSRKLRVLVPPTTIVLSPENSMVPAYYSERHVVRGIANDDVLSKALPQAHAAFPLRQIVIALPSDSRKEFGRALRVLPILYQDSTVTLLDGGAR